MTLVLFDDNASRNDFRPISSTRALFDVKIGCLTPCEQFRSSTLKLLTSKYLTDITKSRHPSLSVNDSSYDKDDLYLNSLFSIQERELDRLIQEKEDFVITSRNKVLIARLSKEDSEYFCDSIVNGKILDLKKLHAKTTDLEADPDRYGPVCWHMWNLISDLPKTLSEQLLNQKQPPAPGALNKKGKGPLFVHRESTVDQETVLDTSDGGIYVGPRAVIAQSTIRGPAFLNEDTEVKPYSILSHSYVGKNCRVAGEVDSSVIMDYTNKSHSGYIGHSYVGEWVNLGANTTTSDLKMTYGTISMYSQDDYRKKVDSGLIKLGAFFGDMAKTSIGTNIYGGIRIGVSSHVHGGFVTRDIPSYVIFGAGIGGENVELELSSAIRTQKRMMSRRDVTMSEQYESLMIDVFEQAADERSKKGIKAKKFSMQ
jgi:UDP-N-acetylglucosamine diphosphorylase / glucose-1-phosphate thymidylyltransferase / UDP-N-acetylgalactosamine diphosphorylase / glucosamine-1-phosphate N-acetyltransferase / galactosamine-1-phosphate N-acetyltransferase